MTIASFAVGYQSELYFQYFTVVLCTTLKPNGKFSGNVFGWTWGLTNSEKDSKTVGSLLSGSL